jgi:hypothetical protein
MLPQIMTVQGQQVDSINEWNLARAFDAEKIPYIFQYEVFGGNVRGGAIIDFLVQLPPMPTPVELKGSYWHESGRRSYDDILRDDQVENIPGFAPMVVFTDEETATVEIARQYVRQRF